MIWALVATRLSQVDKATERVTCDILPRLMIRHGGSDTVRTLPLRPDHRHSRPCHRPSWPTRPGRYLPYIPPVPVVSLFLGSPYRPGSPCLAAFELASWLLVSCVFSSRLVPSRLGPSEGGLGRGYPHRYRCAQRCVACTPSLLGFSCIRAMLPHGPAFICIALSSRPGLLLAGTIPHHMLSCISSGKMVLDRLVSYPMFPQ